MNCVCDKAYLAGKCGCAIKSNTDYYKSGNPRTNKVIKRSDRKALKNMDCTHKWN